MSKFPNPIKTLLETNLTQRLNELGVKEPNLETYVLLVDKTDDYKYQTFDEIYRMWITPKIVGARIKLEKVLDFLESPMNCAPLRIKISLQRKLIILEFSQRFRSQKIIKESNPNNNLAPFVIRESNSVFNEEYERKLTVNRMFFNRILTEGSANILITIGINDFKEYMTWHFKTYRFYPANVVENNKSKITYSNITIEKNQNSNQFTLYKNGNTESVEQQNLNFDEAIMYYLKKELKYYICGVQIKQV